MSIKIISLFTGAGGLDLGFKNAGFDTIWANEFDSTIWETFEYNFPKTKLDKRSITDINADEIPDSEGIIGGPPCQSWSEAGKGLGIHDKRGRLFYDYIRVLKAKKPKFFLVENVSGILNTKHSDAFNGFINDFKALGYNLSFKLVDANDYNVPENRLRVIIVGYRQDLGKKFIFPNKIKNKPVLSNAIADLATSAMPALDKNKTNGSNLKIANNEYMTGSYSTIYMSRNRVRSWDEPSFTIQAGGRHAPLHPQAPKMKKIGENKMVFVPEKEDLYRRLSVRECARIQTFPDNFIFKYTNLSDGYKMIGNAVPVNLAFSIASQIKKDLYE